MGSYVRFMRQQWPLLIFGFITIFIGNIGQSFFLGSFGADIQQSLAISPAQYGFIYAMATLSSGTIIFFFGGMVDRWPLKKTIMIVGVLLLASCAWMSNIHAPWMLFVAFWGLRLSGQGLFPLVSQTAMIRSYTLQRGKALSIAGSGVALGEMVLPMILAAAIAFIGWRETWLSFMGIIALYLISALWLLNLSDKRGCGETQDSQKSTNKDPVESLGRKAVVSDWRFWAIIPAVLYAPFVVTGIFIQQEFVLTQKSWPASILAASFVGYGFLHWLSSMVAGSLVDRYSAKSLLPLLPLPLMGGLLVLTFASQIWTAPVFMALLGFGMGASGLIIGALWAEIYGVKHIGSIRAMVTSMMIVSTAASPWIFGVLIEKGWNTYQLFGLFSMISVVIFILLLPAYRSLRA